MILSVLQLQNPSELHFADTAPVVLQIHSENIQVNFIVSILPNKFKVILRIGKIV